MTFEEISKRIEAAGYSWAVEGRPGGSYSAVVEFGPGMYIADTLADGWSQGGGTPADALEAAFKYAADRLSSTVPATRS